MKLIALYKAYRGGEWLDASLRSILAHVDGVVVVLATQPWTGERGQNNCRRVLSRWVERMPANFFRFVLDNSQQQEEQYRSGLATIWGRYGDEAAVLVIDTDEVWSDDALRALKRTIEENPQAHYYTGLLRTYLRSPLYQVWPMETAEPLVALRSAKEQLVLGRFRDRSAGPTVHCNEAVFDHYCYVRESVEEIADKFFLTNSQETAKSNPNWLADKWPVLPRGQNLHMTFGHENVWHEIKILPCPAVHLPHFCSRILQTERARWQKTLETDSPLRTLVPTPTRHDARMYPEFGSLAADVGMLRDHLKMTYLESLVLHRVAKEVPSTGKIMEIGSGSGGSLAVVSLASGATLWAVDPFKPYDEETHGGTARGVTEGDEREFWEIARHYRYAHRVRQIRHNSDEAAQYCPEEAFDLLLVDGNHSYQIVKRDFELYWPKVKPGGLLLAHDYTTRFPGVIKAAQEWGVPYTVLIGTSLLAARKF